jgi:cobalt-zinc-cadmium efflux system outer membrane protein
MRFHCAAVFAAVLTLSATDISAQGPSTLTLEAAFERVLTKHPQLARFQHRQDALSAEIDSARQQQPLTVEAELENAPGTGTASGLDRAEMTVSLASVLETGGKRHARVAMAQERINALTIEQETQRVDLLAEVARRYLDVLAAQTLATIADDEVGQRQRAVEAAKRRMEAGASPDSVRLAAIAAAARARLERERIRAELLASKRRLGSLWSERTPSFDAVTGDIFTPPAVANFESIAALLERSPELRRFADEKRLRQARLQLARTARSPDIEWQLGVRRLEDSQDWAAVAGVTVPIGTRSRADPGIRAARAELAELDLEKQAEELSLYATLVEAHARLTAAGSEVSMAAQDVLPALQQAETAAERAYRAGALSYLEWAQVQSDRTEARREQVAAAVQAHRALIEIQRLTGESFVRSAQARTALEHQQ